jgi:DNA relaxase NicK
LIELEDTFLKQPDEIQVSLEILNNNRFYLLLFFEICKILLRMISMHKKCKRDPKEYKAEKKGNRGKYMVQKHKKAP